MFELFLYPPEQFVEVSGPITSNQLLLDHPQLHLHLCKDKHIVACCSLWWRDTPDYQSYHTGLVGHFQSQNQHAAVQLLQHAQFHLRQQGVEYLIGPMDGSTWRSYRLVCADHDELPPFILEPRNPDYWNSAFQQAGYKVVTRYISTIHLIEQHATSDMNAYMQQQKMRLTSLAECDIDSTLAEIHALSCRAFAENFLYSDIALSEFKGLYIPLLEHVDKEWLLLLYTDDELAAYAFCLPDPTLQPATLVFKTLAVAPQYHGQGIGRWLTQATYQRAAARGFKRMVHALMHEDNTSRQMSREGKVFRHYCLYGREV